MPTIGVDVVTGARPGPSDVGVLVGDTYFVVGQAERGDTAAAVLVRSMSEYAEKLGARVTYGFLFDDLETFFAEGGARAQVARVVGPAATKGTLMLQDRAGTPVNTVKLDAKNPGAWSTQLSVEVQDGVLSNTFTVLVTLNGVLVEAYREKTDPAALVTDVNNRSAYLTAANQSSATAAPNNNPKVIAATALSAGADDRASIIASHYTDALSRFGPSLGSGIVAIPGQAAGTVGAALIAHAKANRRIVALAAATGTTVSAAKTAANGLRATAGAEHAGLFYSWVKIPDGAGGNRTIPPEGYVAGVRARTFRQAGPWRAPAGEIASARHVTGVETDLTRADIDSLADSRVNPIRQVVATTRLYGWRSLSADETNYKLLSGRDVLDVVAELAEAALERFVFAPVDSKGRLFAAMATDLTAIVEPMRAAGGLYEKLDPSTGEVVDPGYVIDTGPSVNTPTSLANNEVHAVLALRVAPAAELIRLTITKAAFDQSL